MSFRKIFYVLIFFLGCKSTETEIPAGIISKDSMINVMADIHLAESRLVNNRSMTTKRDLKAAHIQRALAKSNIDTARFNASFYFYAAHPDLFSEMYEQVVVEISKRQAERKGK